MESVQLQQLLLPAAGVALAVFVVVLSMGALRLALVARRENCRQAKNVARLQQELSDLTRPEMLFTGPIFDQRVTACIIPIVRAEVERWAVARQDPNTSNGRDRAGENREAPARKSTPPSNCTSSLSTDELLPYYEALVASLTSGQANLDPDGYMEVSIGEVIQRLPSHPSADECSRALRQLNHCFDRERKDVLGEQNFLRTRHLRSLSGEPNIRVGIKLEALPLFLQEPLKG